MKTIIPTLVLLTFGGIAGAIGAIVMVEPAILHSQAGIHPVTDASLLSEIRAPGGLLLAAGITIMFASLRPHRRGLGWAISVLVYLGYAAGRITGFILDGFPHDSLIGAFWIELAAGLISLLFLVLKPQSGERTAPAY